LETEINIADRRPVSFTVILPIREFRVLPRTVRTCSANDFAELADVMYDAVRNGVSAYNDEQRQAWVSERRSGPEWESRLAGQTIFAAEEGNRIVGFISLAENGYIDFAHVRPASQGTGVFRQLFEKIEKLARKRNVSRLWVHASLMAEPAFSAVGFSVTEDQVVQVSDQTLRRFEMEKLLDG
jgi:putative acetyltransferase